MHNLTGKKYVSVQDFKGKKLVQIREYYEKDGALLPGKKGIALSLEDFKKLMELGPLINEELVDDSAESKPKSKPKSKDKPKDKPKSKTKSTAKDDEDDEDVEQD